MKTPFGWPAHFRLFDSPIDDKQMADSAESSPWMHNLADGSLGGSLSEAFFDTYDWLTWNPIATKPHASILTQGATDSREQSFGEIEVCEGKDSNSSASTSDAIEACGGKGSMPGKENEISIELCEGADRRQAKSSDGTMETCLGNDPYVAQGMRGDVKTGGMDPMPNSSDKKSMETCVGNDANGYIGTERKPDTEQANGIGVATWLDPAFVAQFGMTGWGISWAMLGFHLQSSDAVGMESELAPQYGRQDVDLKFATSSEQGSKTHGWFDDGVLAGFGS